MVPMIAIVVSLWVASATYGQDLDALKASFTEEIKALDSRNLDAAVVTVSSERQGCVSASSAGVLCHV
jgi:DNA-binding transcriptional regulator YbjK